MIGDNNKMNRLLRSGCVVIVCGVAGCAQSATSVTTAKSAPAHGSVAEAGVILSMRAVAAPSDATWRTALLADANVTTIANDSAARPMIEFIVRDDTGATISVVQSNALGLNVGDHVTILHDTRTHLVRPSGA
jgi:outer membrane lipoprotein SlyB